MKKTAAIMILCIGMMLIMIGCGKKEKEENGDSEITPTPAVSDEEGSDTEDTLPLENPIVKEDYDFNDYIKLGRYKGIEVEVEKQEVKDEDIELAIQQDLMENGATPVEVTDRPVKFGDTVNIDFTGYHNGEAFDGGSAEGYDLTVGSGAFISGFEDQLIGAEVNQEIEVNVVFPEEYGNSELAGEPAVFKVKINKIQYYELTEDFIKDMGFENENDYREYVTQELKNEYEENMKEQKKNYVYNAVIKNSEITVPENLLEYYEYEYKTMYNNVAAGYGYDLETFLTLYGYTMENFEAQAEYYANAMAVRELVVKAISTLEKIEITEEEYQEKAAEMAEYYGYDSTEEFLKDANEEALKEDLLFDKVIDFLVAESVEI